MIIGAGLTGLIAAHAFPHMPVIEKAPSPRLQHQAVLRFRAKAVSDLTGIDFKRVMIHKGIWYNGKFHEPNIQMANMYAQKVVGKTIDRSIWNIGTEPRYIAPANFYERLIEHVGNRIAWDTEWHEHAPVTISTIPLPAAMAFFNVPTLGVDFEHKAITVIKARIPNADVYQTIYYPSPDNTLYRASITGDSLICEFAGLLNGRPDGALADVLQSFALVPTGWEDEKIYTQSFGKIAPIDEEYRKAVISVLTEKHGVYSLGRFATWRNIMLDDVVNDITIIKRLASISSYERRLMNLK